MIEAGIMDTADPVSSSIVIDRPLAIGVTAIASFGSFPVLVVVSEVWTAPRSILYSSSFLREWKLGWPR